MLDMCYIFLENSLKPCSVFTKGSNGLSDQAEATFINSASIYYA